ncbi:MAG: class I SAM-dependent methyltransferase [Chlamydiota bacterium]
MAAIPSSSPKDSDFQQWVVPADHTRNFGKVYHALRNYMTLHPECDFVEVAALLKANQCRCRLFALATSPPCPKPEWPPGTKRKYQLFISFGTIPQAMRSLFASSEDVNHTRLSQCGFSSFWLMNHTVLLNSKQSLCGQLERFVDCFKGNPAIEFDPAVEEAFLEAKKLNRTSDLWAQMSQEELKNDMATCQRAIGMIVEQKLSNYCPKPGTFFEIGSGYHPVLAHLSSEDASRVHLSDINPEAVEHLKAAYTGAVVSHYDVLAETGGEGQTYDCITLNDVLNTFSYADIEKAVGEAWKMLKPGGHLISFTLRNPALNFCLDEYREKGFIYFPLFDAQGLWKGIHVVPKEELVQCIERMKPEFGQLKKALQTYASLGTLSLLELSMYCTQTIGKDVTEIHILADAFLQLECPRAERVIFDEYHYTSVVTNLQTAGFVIKECQKEEGYYVGPITDEHRTLCPGYNHFYVDGLDNRVGILPYLYSDGDDQDVKEEAQVHVIVAQKPFARVASST